jgi:hypothetical protein
MKKRKFVDKYTSMGEIKPVQDSDWNQGCESVTALKFYAVLKSDAKYETPDDNYANFSGHTEETPKFSSIKELIQYMNRKHIEIGSKLRKVVPINNWEDKTYDRVVWMPITRIEIMSEYHTESNVRMMVSQEREEGIVDNPKFDGDEKKLKVNLYKSFLQNLYTRTRAARTPNNNSFQINIEEIVELFKILGIEEEKKEEQCNTNLEEEK